MHWDWGKVRLLEQVDEMGSIRGAAAAPKMSYRRAWLLIQAAEETFGAALITAAVGARRLMHSRYSGAKKARKQGKKL